MSQRTLALSMIVMLLVFGCDGVGDDDTGFDELEDLDADGFNELDDCNDNDASVFPGAEEACNGIDDDCDGLALPDEIDVDGDGVMLCADDCDDEDPLRFPGNEEACDGVDNDCSGDPDEDEVDVDGDGVMVCAGDCDDLDPVTHAGAEELCDDKDNDCDGSPGADEVDTDGDGYRGCDGDCDDSSDAVYPGAFEACDGLDNDCDPTTDEDADDDSDGFRVCDGDCDDADGAVNPDAEEVCGNLVDDNCNGEDDGCGYHGTFSLADAGAKLVGEAAGDGVGPVAAAGDVDGDGLGDVLVGARYNDGGGTDSGAAYLLYGGGLHGTVLLGYADVKLVGEADGDWAGAGVASAGDVDGDGIADVLVGALGESTNGTAAGAVYLLYGGSLSGDVALAEADVKMLGEGADNYAGRVASAGDVDGDGYDDVVVGAYHESFNGQYSGAAYLLYGGALSGEVDLGDADAKMVGEGSTEYAGCAVAGAGDVNGDGLGDLIIGAYRNSEGGSNAGAAYLVLGPVVGQVELSSVPAKYFGEAAHDLAGWAVSGAGDIDGDGLDDVLVGAYEHTGGGDHAGAAYLIHGPGQWSSDLSDSDGKYLGEETWDYAGIAVSGAGDINGDGHADFLIGAKYDTGGPGAGAAYLVYGPSFGIIDMSALTKFTGEVLLDEAGRYVSGAGDVNGDGYDDFLVGAPVNGAGGTEAGAAYLVYGQGL